MTDDIHTGRAFVNGGTLPRQKSTPTARAADVNGDGDVSRQKFQLKDQIMGDRRLHDSCRRVLYFLIDWYGYESRDYTFTRHERLAEYAGLPTRTVRRCIRQLIKLGYIAVKQRGRWGLASEYWVINLSPHMGPQLCPDAHGATAVTAHGACCDRTWGHQLVPPSLNTP